MASTSKLNDDLNDMEREENIDRISSLPNKILGRILSALPTKHAVATSVLSTRWLNVFTLITVLNFDDSLLFTVHDDLPYDKDIPSMLKSFMERMFSLCPLINRLNLECHQENTMNESDPIYDSADINSALSYAVNHKVKELNLLLESKVLDFDHSYIDLNPCLFSCETLEVLKLDGKFSLSFPLSFRMPFLRIVHFCSVAFRDSDSVTRFFASCPALEEFTTVRCCWEDVDVINIFAPSLRRLALDVRQILITYVRRAVVLNCPNLVYLSYIDNLAENYSIINLPAHVEAIINVDGPQNDNECSLVALLTGLSTVTCLSLGDQSMEVLKCDVRQHTNLPVLYNLTKLSITCWFGREVTWEEVVTKLLDSTPALKILIIQVWAPDMGTTMVVSEDQSELQATVVPSCLSTTLKVVEVECYMGLKDEFEIIKFFLMNANVLEELKIHCKPGLRLTALEKRELLKLHVCSETCSIALNC